MEEYKGIYYGDDNEQKFYEGGAHFKYEALYQILEALQQSTNQSKESQSFKRQNFSSKNIKDSKIINKTRNILAFAEYNYKTEANNVKKANDSSSLKPKSNYSKKILDFKLKLNTKYNKTNKNFSNKINKLQKKIKKNTLPKKLINSRNNDFYTYRANPNSLFKKHEPNILFNRKNRQSSMSLHENKTNNKSANKSTNKSTNKTNNKSTVYSCKKSFPDLKNIFNNKIKNDLTDRESNKKIKVDLKKINKIIKSNISEIEVGNSKTIKDNSNYNLESITKNNLSQSKSKVNNEFSQTNNLKKKSNNKITILKDNTVKDSIQTNLEIKDSKNISIKINTSSKFHNYTQQKRIKVKNIIKKNNNNKISIVKNSQNNIQNVIELLNSKNKKHTNINLNQKKSRNFDINDIAYNTGNIKPNCAITNDNQLNECFKTFRNNNGTKKNGLLKSAVNVNNKKIPIGKNKLYKLNNSVGFSNEMRNNKTAKKIKTNNQGFDSNGNVTLRNDRKSPNKINCVNTNKMKNNGINFSTKSKKISLNNIINNRKIQVNKNLNRNNSINKKGIILHKLIKASEKNK